MSKKITLLTLISFFSLGLNAQSFVWAEDEGAAGDQHGFEIATDAAGNSYVAGTFDDNFTLGGQTMTTTTTAYYIAKYDSTGTVIWSMQVDSAMINDIETDGQFLYITGSYSGMASIGSASLPASEGADDLFVAKLDQAGNVIFIGTVGGLGYESANDLDIDAAGNVYITGSADSSAVVGSDTLGKDNSLILVKYSPAGTVLMAYAAEMTGNGSAAGQQIDVDAAGTNINIIGFTNVNSNDSLDLENNMYYNSGGQTGSFIAQYDAMGDIVRYTHITGGTASGVTDLEVDNTGNVYTSVYFDAMYYEVTKHDANLNALWTIQDAESSVYPNGKDVEIDATGNVYVGGSFWGEADFGTDSLSTGGGQFNGFVAKYNSTGVFEWVKQVTGDNAIHEIGLDANGNIYMTGSFSTAGFDSITLASAGGTDIFVAKLSTLDVTTGMLPAVKQAGFSMYPNPASDLIYITNASADAMLNVMDIIGRTLITGQLRSNQTSYDVSGLAAGVYFVEVVSGNTRVSKKLVIE